MVVLTWAAYSGSYEGWRRVRPRLKNFQGPYWGLPAAIVPQAAAIAVLALYGIVLTSVQPPMEPLWHWVFLGTVVVLLNVGWSFSYRIPRAWKPEWLRLEEEAERESRR
ncbi:hypothetical protein MTQ12_09640 [Brevibacterium sp. R8603A2]|uniref:hypothetical protein n=1 Tax=Brevibacterium sp. R8603A2 TaxID=2929779 RepID=UPI001FF7C45E|nr:hypothetical protein [Brevibacterium sp. R8603A2]MCK1803302.1 hypothetical protein [Brevibacterium sp. R8603A2]